MARNPLEKHSRLSPSTSSRWLACPGSAKDDLPERPPNQASIDGDTLHEQAATLLGTGILSTIPDAWVRDYVKYVKVAATRKKLAIEEQLQSFAVPDLYGTPDALIVGQNCLSVVDLKTGSWKVNAKNNPQLKTYLMMARENYGSFDTYIGTIHQRGKPSEAEFTEEDLDDHALNVVTAANSPDKFYAGDHCLWCPLLAFRKCSYGEDYAQRNKWRTRYTHLKATYDPA